MATSSSALVIHIKDELGPKDLGKRTSSSISIIENPPRYANDAFSVQTEGSVLCPHDVEFPESFTFSITSIAEDQPSNNLSSKSTAGKEKLSNQSRRIGPQEASIWRELLFTRRLREHPSVTTTSGVLLQTSRDVDFRTAMFEKNISTGNLEGIDWWHLPDGLLHPEDACRDCSLKHERDTREVASVFGRTLVEFRQKMRTLKFAEVLDIHRTCKSILRPRFMFEPTAEMPAHEMNGTTAAVLADKLDQATRKIHGLRYQESELAPEARLTDPTGMNPSRRNAYKYCLWMIYMLSLKTNMIKDVIGGEITEEHMASVEQEDVRYQYRFELPFLLALQFREGVNLGYGLQTVQIINAKVRHLELQGIVCAGLREDLHACDGGLPPSTNSSFRMDPGHHLGRCVHWCHKCLIEEADCKPRCDNSTREWLYSCLKCDISIHNCGFGYPARVVLQGDYPKKDNLSLEPLNKTRIHYRWALDECSCQYCDYHKALVAKTTTPIEPRLKDEAVELYQSLVFDDGVFHPEVMQRILKRTGSSWKNPLHAYAHSDMYAPKNPPGLTV